MEASGPRASASMALRRSLGLSRAMRCRQALCSPVKAPLSRCGWQSRAPSGHGTARRVPPMLESSPAWDRRGGWISADVPVLNTLEQHRGIGAAPAFSGLRTLLLSRRPSSAHLAHLKLLRKRYNRTTTPKAKKHPRCRAAASPRSVGEATYISKDGLLRLRRVRQHDRRRIF